MIKSMTGFGRSKLEENSREYIVEIKSVNHKYSDISIKMPRSISCFEENVKNTIAKYDKNEFEAFKEYINQF